MLKSNIETLKLLLNICDISCRIYMDVELKKGFENSRGINLSFIAYNELNYLIYHNENNNNRKRKHGIIKRQKD